MAKLVSLTSDFGVQTQGVGIMEATILSISSNVSVVHLMHGLPAFDVIAAARTMETVLYLPVGSHVCVCDPGVGTSRRAIICRVRRGDYLIGPDNGVLRPAMRLLGGVAALHEIANDSYMRQPVSALFHGRDVFAPAAAHLANGVDIEEFGPAIDAGTLVVAPYDEAIDLRNSIHARIIQINRYGSIHLNILHDQWDTHGATSGQMVWLELPDQTAMELPVGRTFGDVLEGQSLIMKDDYGRVEVATNLGSFVDRHPVNIGDRATVHFVPPG